MCSSNLPGAARVPDLTTRLSTPAAEAVPLSLAALPRLESLEELRLDARVALGPDVAAVLRCQVLEATMAAFKAAKSPAAVLGGRNELWRRGNAQGICPLLPVASHPVTNSCTHTLCVPKFVIVGHATEANQTVQAHTRPNPDFMYAIALSSRELISLIASSCAVCSRSWRCSASWSSERRHCQPRSSSCSSCQRTWT